MLHRTAEHAAQPVSDEVSFPMAKLGIVQLQALNAHEHARDKRLVVHGLCA